MTRYNFILFILVLICSTVWADDPNNQADLIINKLKNIRQELLIEDYKMPQDSNDIEKSELFTLIEELNALTFSVKSEIEAIESSIEPNDVNIPQSDGGQEAAEPNIAALVSQISQDPNQAVNPLMLADVLFLGGNEQAAAVFYQKALLNIESKTDNSSLGNKAWILYQMGNCLRKTNPKDAEEYYKQLIAEFPACQWAEQASAQQKISRLLSSENDTIEYVKKKPDIEVIQ